jgi:hypothetical protein
MTLELFPNNEIPFEKLFDDRLQKFAITVAAEQKVGALIAPDGTVTIVQRTDQGYVQFPEKMPVVVQNAIAEEFRIDIPERGEVTHVVVVGPSCGDFDFISRWQNAVLECDRMIERYYNERQEFRYKMVLLREMYPLELLENSRALIRKWQDSGSFVLDVYNFTWSAAFTLMVSFGLFTRMGDRYRMTIPDSIDLEHIAYSMLQFAETMDSAGFVHPERHLVTMTPDNAERANRLQVTLRASPCRW